MDTVRRPAARVLCIDECQRVLLLRWKDPAHGRYVWEPPGGGIEPGERAIDAARRELGEETGLPTAGITDHRMMVARDFQWNGKRYVGEEAFFISRFEHTPTLTFSGLEEGEVESFCGHTWVPWQNIDQLPDSVEPPGITVILRAMAPAGPWNSG